MEQGKTPESQTQQPQISIAEVAEAEIGALEQRVPSRVTVVTDGHEKEPEKPNEMEMAHDNIAI